MLFLCMLLLSVSMGFAIEHNKINGKTPQTSILVSFDPYVSVLDKENRYRYNTTDLLPFVEKAGTRFSRFLITLSSMDLNLLYPTSLSLSATTFAVHNRKMHPKNKLKIDIWIAFKDTSIEFLPPQLVFNRLLNISNEANKIFPKTVTSILLPNSVVDKINGNDLGQVIKMYQFGVVLDPSSCKNISWYHANTSAFPFFTQATFVPITKYFAAKNDTNSDSVCVDCKIFTACKQADTTHKEIGYIVSIPDTVDKSANMTRMVSVWTKLTDWSLKTGIVLIISKAFDTPYEQKVEDKTSGWWRLLEDPKYNSTQDYKFVEKQVIAQEFDLQENQLNLAKLKESHSFSRDHVGVIFSVSNKKRYALAPYSDTELAPIIKSMAKLFSKILLLIDTDNFLALHTLLYELKTVAHIVKHQKMEVIAMPMLGIKTEYKFSVNRAAEEHGFDKDIIHTFIAPFNGMETEAETKRFKDIILDGKDAGSYKFGHSFNVSICQLFDISNEDEKQFVRDTLQDAEAGLVVFYFEVDKETVKLGAQRMFEQSVVELEYCKHFLIKVGAGSLSTTFVLLHYASDREFYKNPWAIQTFVNYWEKLTFYAGNSNTTIIMNSAVDSVRHFITQGVTKPETEIGWWRFRDRLEENDTLFYAKDLWVDKKQDAITTAKLHFSKGSKHQENAMIQKWSSGLILLIVLIPVTVCITMLILSAYFIRMHHRKSKDAVSKQELNDFFIGKTSVDEQGESYYKVPYDKNRFEIDSSCFRVEEDGILGSGMFGRVCKGKLLHGTQTSDVAIKMPNPLNIHKTTVTGLLSEIKVLAYIEKHKNIVELLGANTSDVRRGNVFIFIEFCSLGSLDKYLQKQQKDLESDSISGRQNGYENCITSYCNNKAKQLDKIRAKLHKWSLEICSGMAHLARKQVVHADLATRNVLLNGDEVAKIGDFGLSRRMYNYASYVKQQQEPLPWKWMAPESLRLSVFNEKTDMWAYGVTLWEIYSLGDQPYAGLSFNSNFSQTLQLGFRLSKPHYDDGGKFRIMQNCWNLNPDLRPTFESLRESLGYEYMIA